MRRARTAFSSLARMFKSKTAPVSRWILNISRKDRLTAFARQIGFAVDTTSEVVRVVRAPCLFAGGVPGTCAIETSCDSATRKPDRRIGGDVHAVKITINGEYDGRVYHAEGTPIGNHIGGDGKTWSNISIKKGAQDNPEADEATHDLLHRYAKQVVGAVSAAGYLETLSHTRQGLFRIPNTFEVRAAIVPVQDRIRGQRVAIIGLDGTGAYILDLLAKMPGEIHLLDSDCVKWHNLMRAPGAPTAEEIEQVRAGSLRKADYYLSKYTAFREAVHAHPIRVENPEMFADFLSEHPIDYAFVCIDQQPDADSPRQDTVYSTLSEAGIPFIDSGVSITLDGHSIRGAVTTSVYEAGSDMRQNAIPNAKVEGDVPGYRNVGYRNVQLPEVNATAAAFAVMK